MPKSLGHNAAVAEQRAAEKVEDLRRAVTAYNEAIRDGSAASYDGVSRKRRQFVDLLGDYLRLQKALRRIRKKTARRAAAR
jgi:hypothetical protein